MTEGRSPYNPKRDSWLDSLRGLAIVIIVLGHVILGLSDATPGSIYPEQRFIILLLYSFNIPIIFFVSGAVSRDEKKSSGDFWKALIKWVIWPYFLWSFVLVFVQNEFSSAVNHPQPYESLFKTVYAPITLFWFLYAYAFVKIVSYFSLRLMSEKNALFFLFVLSASVFTFFAITGESNIIYQTSIGLFFFAVGKFWQHYMRNSKQLRKYMKGALRQGGVFVFCLICVLGLSYTNYICPEDELFMISNFQRTVLFTGITGIIFWGKCIAFFQQNIVNLGLSVIGRYTMVIYVQHVFFVAGMRTVLLKVGYDYFWVDTLILVALGTFAPILWQMLFDRFSLTSYFGIRSMHMHARPDIL